MTRHNVGDVDVAQFPHSENVYVYVYLESRSHNMHCNIMQLGIGANQSRWRRRAASVS